MSHTPGVQRQHPLVRAYLDDLRSALAGVDPRERAETIDAVRDHIGDALADHDEPTDEDVRAVLARLGPVERIATAATPAFPKDAAQPVWLPSALLLAAIASLSVVLLVPWLAAGVSLACLTASILVLRQTRGSKGLLRTAAVVSALCLAIVAVMAVLLLGTSSSPGTPAPAKPAESVSQ